VQTRRDQLQAYRFLNRRALAALVTGEPDVVEPPMRRLTVTTVSGIMIAILIAVGFALFGVLKPTPGDKWKEAGAIIVERETGARYVLIDNVLHPALNYSSAVLAVGTNQSAHVVLVDRSDLKGARRGATVGIDGIPDSLPSAKSLVKSPWTVCSRLQGGLADQLTARVSVLVGDDARSRPVAANRAVLVRAVTGGGSYLLWHGQRLAVDSPSVATSLGLQNAASVSVGTAFLDAIPPGPVLRAPDVPKVKSAAPIVVGNGHPLVGQLLHVTDNDQSFLVLADGVAALDDVQTALLRTLPIGPGNRPLAPVDTTENVALGLPQSRADWNTVAAQLTGLPSTTPALVETAAQNGGVCAVYRNGARQPAFAVPPSQLPTVAASTITESVQSRQGVADRVVLGPGSAAVARVRDGSPTVFVIAEPGKKFAVTSPDVLSGFGYGAVKPVSLPVQLLPLIPTGPALDPTAARRPVTG
jgi:type VII secretion protein EccB